VEAVGHLLKCIMARIPEISFQFVVWILDVILGAYASSGSLRNMTDTKEEN
jgi:hypothetical protein